MERYSGAAAALVVAGAFWSVLHPPSAQLLRCLAAAAPVWAGYAETARACATRRVPPGPAVRRLCPAVSDIPSANSPKPLELWQGLDISYTLS